MKILALTHKGCELFAVEEARSLIGVRASVVEEGITFDADAEAVMKFTYLSQVCGRVVHVLKSGVHGEDVLESVKSVDCSHILAPEVSWGVHVVAEEKSSRMELREGLVFVLKKMVSSAPDLKKPRVLFVIVCRGKQWWFGVDVCTVDLSKRGYRIFVGRDNVKGTVAVSLLLFAGFVRGQVLLDPFARSGLIPIEAALYATGRSALFFSKEWLLFKNLSIFASCNIDHVLVECDKKIIEHEGKIFALDEQFRSISCAKKNAKIAGVEKEIIFSRQGVQDIDLRLDEKSIDVLVTVPPQPSSKRNEFAVLRIARDLFDRAGFVVKKGGKVVLCVERGKEMFVNAAKENKFQLVKEQDVLQGQSKFAFLLFERIK